MKYSKLQTYTDEPNQGKVRDEKENLKRISIFWTKKGLRGCPGRSVQNIGDGGATRDERFWRNPDHQEKISERIDEDEESDDRKKKQFSPHQRRGFG